MHQSSGDANHGSEWKTVGDSLKNIQRAILAGIGLLTDSYITATRRVGHSRDIGDSGAVVSADRAGVEIAGAGGESSL